MSIKHYEHVNGRSVTLVRMKSGRVAVVMKAVTLPPDVFITDKHGASAVQTRLVEDGFTLKDCEQCGVLPTRLLLLTELLAGGDPPNEVRVYRG